MGYCAQCRNPHLGHFTYCSFPQRGQYSDALGIISPQEKHNIFPVLALSPVGEANDPGESSLGVLVNENTPRPRTLSALQCWHLTPSPNS